MGVDIRKLYESSSGDSWHLTRDNTTGDIFVRHQANEASGGNVRDVGLGVFLTLGRNGPEHQEIWRLISTLIERPDASGNALEEETLMRTDPDRQSTETAAPPKPPAGENMKDLVTPGDDAAKEAEAEQAVPGGETPGANEADPDPSETPEE